MLYHPASLFIRSHKHKVFPVKQPVSDGLGKMLQAYVRLAVKVSDCPRHLKHP